VPARPSTPSAQWPSGRVDAAWWLLGLDDLHRFFPPSTPIEDGVHGVSGHWASSSGPDLRIGADLFLQLN
jgi:hypothetical protein